MQFNPPQCATSFYESFSDLIFATMAIFVLLMIIFLTLVQISEAKTQEELEQKQEALAQAKKAEEQLKELTKTVMDLRGQLKTRSLEIVIAVDVTGSMQEEITHLKATIDTIASAMPSITSLKIGIVAYGFVNKQPLKVFPLAQIQAQEKDGGASFETLKDFMGSLSAKGSGAPVRQATKTALSMLTSSSDGTGQIFMLLGDVGPYELLKQTGDTEASAENEMFSMVSAWHSSNEARKVISLYSAEGQHTNARNRRFFEELSVSAGKNGYFTDHAAKMLAFILKASLDKES